MLPNGVNSHEDDSRANSCASSLDSDENSVGSASSYKEKNKVGRKVARKLGSIGKSVGKRLRKNLGGASKNDDRAKMPPPHYPPPRRPSNTAQTPRHSENNVLVTRLSEQRVQYQDELVKNYLQAAEERFKLDREQKQEVVVVKDGTLNNKNITTQNHQPSLLSGENRQHS